MKLYTVEQIEVMNDIERDEVFYKRAKQLVFLINKALKGQKIEAFEGVNLSEFSILNISMTNYGVYNVEGGKEYMIPLNISLKGYSDNNEMMFGDKKSEKSLQKLINDTLGKDYKIKWSDESIQGDKYINLDLVLPAKVLAPDFLNNQSKKSSTKRIKSKF